MMIKALLFSILLLSSSAWATLEESIFPQHYILRLTPPIANGKYVAFETGFLSKKKLQTYPYEAFVTAFIANERFEEDRKLNTGVLGFKGGLFLPLLPMVPILLQANIGYGKTSFQENPWFGKNSEAIKRTDMFLLESGLVYHYHDFFLAVTYQLHNIKSIDRHLLFSVGGSFQ